MISTVVLRTQSDAKLAALAAVGSEGAFEAIVQRYRRPLHGYCRRLLLSDSRCEDVVQQAFLSAWSSLTAGTEVREVKAWLYRITHNHAINALRRAGYDFDELGESLCGADAPEEDLERRTLMRETLAAVAALPELQREAILRTAVDGQSYEQVAASLGLTDTAVRGLVYRARSSLRAAAAALAPTPLVMWSAGHVRRSGSLTERVAELLGTGGSAGGAAFVLKSATLAATSAVVVGGAVGGVIAPRRATATREVRRAAVHATAAAVRTASPATTHRSAGTSTATTTSGHGSSTPVAPVAIVRGTEAGSSRGSTTATSTAAGKSTPTRRITQPALPTTGSAPSQAGAGQGAATTPASPAPVRPQDAPADPAAAPHAAPTAPMQNNITSETAPAGANAQPGTPDSQPAGGAGVKTPPSGNDGP